MQKCWTFVPDVISKMKLKPDISESKYYHKLLQKAKICKYTDRDKNGYILPNPVKHGSKTHICEFATQIHLKGMLKTNNIITDMYANRNDIYY